jgi:DNA polymerase III epsilon subunit-like protein
MILFFDTETTGIAPKGANWETDFNLFPYIVQLSWKRSDQDQVKDYIIRPEGYEIPAEATVIHGITTQRALDEGEFFNRVAFEFMVDCKEADKIVGHNIYFDTSNIKANVMRQGDNVFIEDMIIALAKEKRIDTMMKTIKFCNIPFKDGKGQKWPTLVELHTKLFNESFPAHNSMYDVLATEKCFNKLVELKVI